MAYSFLTLDLSSTPEVTGSLELVSLTEVRAISYGTKVKFDDKFSLTLHLSSGKEFRVRYIGGSNEEFLSLWRTPFVQGPNPPTDNPTDNPTP